MLIRVIKRTLFCSGLYGNSPGERSVREMGSWRVNASFVADGKRSVSCSFASGSLAPAITFPWPPIGQTMWPVLPGGPERSSSSDTISTTEPVHRAPGADTFWTSPDRFLFSVIYSHFLLVISSTLSNVMCRAQVLVVVDGCEVVLDPRGNNPVIIQEDPHKHETRR